MNAFSKSILDGMQIRKTKEQKTSFRKRLHAYAESLGYGCQEESGALGAKNVIVGDPATASVVFTAHYDTCPVLPVPNFITPKRISFYVVYQALLTLGIFAVAFLVDFLVAFALGLLSSALSLPTELGDFLVALGSYSGVLVVFGLFLFGPANKHTANDNTSGVVTLVEIMSTLSEEERRACAFIFFDMEELGLLGSSGYASKHKDEMAGRLLLNFDCVSDGEHILFALKRSSASYADLLARAYLPTEACTVEFCTKGIFYPSDQAVFDGGVGVCALKYSSRLQTHYMDRIHTPRDTVFREENIAYLTEGSARLCALLVADKADKEMNV